VESNKATAQPTLQQRFLTKRLYNLERWSRCRDSIESNVLRTRSGSQSWHVMILILFLNISVLLQHY